MISFTEAQAQALVTDSGTLKRGQELANSTKWAKLGRNDTAAWGECAGSGSRPYLTGIHLTEPAFKCSCPSRVFPCKHGAGLLLLLAKQPTLFTGNTPPAWLEEWLGKRQQTQEKKVEKIAVAADSESSVSPASAEKEPAPEGSREVDPKRFARMAAGADDLAAWLEDLMRAGLATLDKQPLKFWESQAARLVDNQLPGLAGTLRELATLRHAHADWPGRLLARLGELYLLVRAFQNLPNLPPAARQDVLQQVGINLKKDDLLATTSPVADAWWVLGQFRWEEDRLTARRTWLRGRDTGHLALVLEFAFGSQPFATPFFPQASYQGDVVFYPGLLPLRAAPVNLTFDGTVPATRVPIDQSINQLLHDYADALARQPWLREWPATLTQVLPVRQPDGRWLLYHTTEPGTLPLRFAEEDAPWQLLAESGGQPLTLFGEWDGRAFRVLSSWAGTSPAGETSPSSPLSTRERVPVVRETESSVSLLSFGDSAHKADAGRGGEVDAGKLLRIALLGTRQSSEPIPPFPAPAPSPELQLLLAAGTASLMRKAGYLPPAATTAPVAPAPLDSLPTLGPQGTERLRQMVADSLFLDLLPSYLAQLASAGRRVPETLLVPLLKHATRSPATTAVLGPVLGTRGHWLAAQNPDWAKLLAAAPPAETDIIDLSIWETGTLPERLTWLRQRFAHDANAARALLLAALPAEPAKAQEALLEILAAHLHPDTEPLLETLLKARGQEVRRLATELLVQIPGAALTERLWARAAPLITARRKLLGLGKAALEATLPTAWDKTWLLDGIEEKNSRFMSVHGPSFKTAVGPATARLANLLALLPPSRWTAHLNLTPDELLTAALASEWALPLLSAWAQSTLLHRDTAFAGAFLSLWMQERPALEKAHCNRDIDWVSLATLLPTDARQQLVLQPILQRVRRQEPSWTQDISFIPAPWPRALSLAVVETIADKLANTATLNRASSPFPELWQLTWQLSQTVAPHLAPADFAWAIQHIETITEPHESFQNQLHTFVSALRFQADLEASLTEWI